MKFMVMCERWMIRGTKCHGSHSIGTILSIFSDLRQVLCTMLENQGTCVIHISKVNPLSLPLFSLLVGAMYGFCSFSVVFHDWMWTQEEEPAVDAGDGNRLVRLVSPGQFLCSYAQFCVFPEDIHNAQLMRGIQIWYEFFYFGLLPVSQRG